MRITSATFVAPAALALALSGGVAWAQATEMDAPAQTPGPEEMATTPISEAEIEQFAEAAEKVQVLQQASADKLKAAEDSEALARTQKETQREMVRAIEETGLTAQRYQEIFVAFQSDPEINAKVRQELSN